MTSVTFAGLQTKANLLFERSKRDFKRAPPTTFMLSMETSEISRRRSLGEEWHLNEATFYWATIKYHLRNGELSSERESITIFYKNLLRDWLVLERYDRSDWLEDWAAVFSLSINSNIRLLLQDSNSVALNAVLPFT